MIHGFLTDNSFIVQLYLAAIKIYRKTPSLDASFAGLSSVSSPASLREDVVSVVENEIHASAQDYELDEDEYRQLQLQCWARFYSQWLQYQVNIEFF